MQRDLYFECDKCDGKFTIGFGFLGSKEDFESFVKNKKSDNIEIECSPRMELVSLCEICVNKIK